MEKKFRFIHVADTHNGANGNASRYNEYSSLRIEKTTEKGINVRQDDIDKALEQVMDLAIEHKVDAVLHAGDGTDAWGYKQPYVFNVYASQIARLSEHDIEYIEIVGNHNLPKKIGVGCYLETLGRFPKVHTSYKGFYETIEIPKHNVVIHCVPSTFNQDFLNESLEEARPIEGKINIGMGHFGVTSIKHYAENSVNSLVANLDQLIACNMDYFALGDYHKRTDFGHNIHYSGSIERMSFGEMENKPQVLLVEIDKETKNVEVTPLFLKVRDMIEIESIDVDSINSKENLIEELNELIKQRLLRTEMKDKIVRFRIKKLPKHLKHSVDTTMIKELTNESLYFKLELMDKIDRTEENRTSNQTKFEGVLEGWQTFMKSVEEDGSFDKEKLIKMGYERLADAYES